MSTNSVQMFRKSKSIYGLSLERNLLFSNFYTLKPVHILSNKYDTFNI